MSSGRCWSSDTYNPVPGVMEGVPSANNYQGGFGTTLMAKVSGGFFFFLLIYIHIRIYIYTYTYTVFPHFKIPVNETKHLQNNINYKIKCI